MFGSNMDIFCVYLNQQFGLPIKYLSLVTPNALVVQIQESNWISNTFHLQNSIFPLEANQIDHIDLNIVFT